ncbi:MAG: DUF5060 domain-containing protein [Candidatus Glassbacteria bacterium]|nr:DUF5060 domain-containing protein [Candidatus Glassbacteria bacterium]
MKKLMPLLLLAAAPLFGFPPQPGLVGQWAIFELSFNASGWSNPFLEVELHGVFTAPSGTEHRVEGFYDGDGAGGVTGDVFKLRFAPGETGAWRWRTESNRDALDGQAGEFTVTPSANRGPLRYDPRRPRWLHWADGTVFFESGADDPECFLADKFITQQQRYEGIDYLAAKGVNSLYFGVTNAGPGDGTAEMKVTPWMGGFDKPEFDNICLLFMNRLEGVVRRLDSHGMTAHIVLYLDDCCQISDAITAEQEELLIRYLCARFGSFSGIVWNLAEEFDECFTEQWCSSRAAMFVRHDPLGHPVTVHQLSNDEFKLAGDPNFGTTAMQFNRTAPDSINAMVRHLRDQTEAAGRPLPASLIEWTPLAPEEAETARRGMWAIAAAGGSYQVFNKNNDEPMTAEFALWEETWGYADIVRRTMEALPLDEMEPDNSLVSRGFCLVQPGEHYLVYLPEGGEVTVEVTGSALAANWIDPRTGERTQAGAVEVGKVSFSTPTEGDWALVLE